MAPEVTSYKLHDPVFPVAELLVGEAAGELGAQALRELADLELQAIAPQQIAYRAGQTIRVLYAVTVTYPDGTVRAEDLVAYTSIDGPPDGALVLESTSGPVGFWRYPWDPWLPGLGGAWGTTTLLGMLGGARGQLHALPTPRHVSYSPRPPPAIGIEPAAPPRRLPPRGPAP